MATRLFHVTGLAWICSRWTQKIVRLLLLTRDQGLLFLFMRDYGLLPLLTGGYGLLLSVCASDRQNYASPIWKQILASHTLSGQQSQVILRKFSHQKLPNWRFLLPGSPPCLCFCPCIFSCSLDRDIIEVGVGRARATDYTLAFGYIPSTAVY